MSMVESYRNEGIECVDEDGTEHHYLIQPYRGQDYASDQWALTVAMVEDCAEVYLVGLSRPVAGFEECRRLLIEDLHNYLNWRGEHWLSTHTVFKHTHCNFTNPKSNVIPAT